MLWLIFIPGMLFSPILDYIRHSESDGVWLRLNTLLGQLGLKGRSRIWSARSETGRKVKHDVALMDHLDPARLRAARLLLSVDAAVVVALYPLGFADHALVLFRSEER